MSTHLRSPTLNEVLQKNLPADSGREILINPDGGMFDARTMAAALRRAGTADVIIVPPGEYTAFELKKSVRMRSQIPGTVSFQGTMTIRSEFASFSGINFRSPQEQSAFQVEKGALILDDCVIRGEITAVSPTENVRVYLKGCLAGQTDEGIVLSHLAFMEISESRIAGCRVGLALRQGASAALYHSRIESCLNTDETDPGVGIFAEQASLYCEGVVLRDNGVGIYLKNCPEALLLSSLFHGSRTSAVIVADSPTTASVVMHSCVASQQTSSLCPQLSLSGGSVRLAHCRILTSPSPALSAELTRLEILNSSFLATGATAIDIHSCHVSGESVTAESQGGPALTASGCQGEFRSSRLIGQPPTKVTVSPQLNLSSSALLETSDDLVPGDPQEVTSAIDTAIQILQKSIVQESVRQDLERILRLAHAGQQRKLQGLPVTDRNFHCVFMGPPGTGKIAAARVLAEALFAFDAIANSRVAELHLDDLESATTEAEVKIPKREEGVIFLRVHDSVTPSPGLRQVLAHLLDQPDTIVILEGERDPLRRVLRSVHGLERMFRKTLYFTRYGPIELASHFAKLSEIDQIAISHEATQTLLATLQLYCERKDKRFANTTGVEILYETSRHRFLERCSLANRVDLQIEARDLDVPQDNTLHNALDRSPAFVTWCPTCNKENPWLPELAPSFVCLHCEAPYTAAWGTWKEGTSYRELHEASGQNGSSPRQILRAPLPVRQG
jgi:hypothetical protein